ncbi:hypothetical protein P3S68_013921 [Capsicum galapagoense]
MVKLLHQINNLLHRIINLLHQNCNLMVLLDQEYKATTPIKVEPMVKSDEPEAQFQEAAGGENNFTMPETNLPKEPGLLDKNQSQHQSELLQEGCTFGVNEYHIAYLELETKGKSFFKLLSYGADYCIRNNHVRIQEAPVEENGHLELYTFSPIQEPVVLDYFANANSELNMPDFFDTLAKYDDVTVFMAPGNELITPDFSKQGTTVQSNAPQMQTQEAADEVKGLLGLTAPFSQIQESMMTENNKPETFDMGDTLFEKNQTQHQPAPEEESETLCETEQSSFVVSDLVKAMLNHATMEERFAALRASQITLMFDQQSWKSKTHLQDMLL